MARVLISTARVSDAAQSQKDTPTYLSSQACSFGRSRRTAQAARHGITSMGNTFQSIALNELKKVTPSTGCSTGTTSGTSRATATFISTVYVTTPAMFPPSLPVTTAHAVAVGHIMQSIAASKPSRRGMPGTNASSSASAAKEQHWISSSQSIHLWGRS